MKGKVENTKELEEKEGDNRIRNSHRFIYRRNFNQLGSCLLLTRNKKLIKMKYKRISFLSFLVCVGNAILIIFNFRITKNVFNNSLKKFENVSLIPHILQENARMNVWSRYGNKKNPFKSGTRQGFVFCPFPRPLYHIPLTFVYETTPASLCGSVSTFHI